jgi:DNA-binding MurR/RpiR family transcriptional regulator
VTLKSLFEGRRLTPVQRRIAQTLAAHVARADDLTSAELANLAGVSQPSVIRFATALGYSGYADLRRALRAVGPSRELAQHVDGLNKYQLAVSEELANLTRLTTWLANATDLATIGGILAASQPLVIVGLRASEALARYFGFYARKVHPRTQVIVYAGSAAIDHLEEARGEGASALFVVAMPRWPHELVPVLDAASSMGYVIEGLTDQAGSPVLEYLAHPLLAPVGTTLLYDTHARALVTLSLLVEAIADADPALAEPAMEAFEARASAHHYFLKS